MSNFAHLHLHTQYSLLDGANKVKQVIESAAALGQPAISMTDHGNMHGAVEFYSIAKKVGIKPLIGCELYVTGGSRLERKPILQGGKPTFHLTALALNKTGYTNLCQLVSLAYKEGFYHKPRVDHELLKIHSAGLIILSGCVSSELAHYTLLDDRKGAQSVIEFFANTFKDRYFLEIQPHPIAEQQKHNAACLDLAQQFGLPLVATTDCHYGSAEDHFAQEILMCISTGKTVNDHDRIRHIGLSLHLKTEQEMLSEFGPAAQFAKEAINMSAEIASRCDLNFGFDTYYMPRYSDKSENDHADLMGNMARAGLEERLKNYLDTKALEHSAINEYHERLELEISLIKGMGFASYFLVVADFIVWAKEHNIPVGPGRGSVAGSLVAFALRITEVDPIIHSLLFERFLNPERISMPDIDVDFCIYGREQVIKYVSDKYGKDKVAQIATFGTLKAKAAIKDVGRALGISYAETDRIAQLIPAPRQGFDYSIPEALDMEPKLKEYAQGDGKQLIDLAIRLEGLTRHSSTHAAGLVIGDRPLMKLLPMMVDKDGNDVTQFSMNYVEKIGLVKFDFLGLKTLTVIATACDIINESTGIRLDMNEIPLDDPGSYTLLCKGNTVGVFQLESSGITEMTVRLKPNCFDDLVAILALYRPGPLDAGMVDHYIERKHGREPVKYLHPLMEPVLKSTYGIMLYQEQIMQLARVLAGYSLAEADFLRKAMGKKIPEEMAKQKVRFMEGTSAKGIENSIAEEIFSQMETFARYGFNRSHSVAYAMVSFQTAYLKAHHEIAFMAALMTHDRSDSDKTLKNLTECRKQNIVVLPPDVNESQAGFSVVNQSIRFGLEAVKGVGDKAVKAIIETRQKRPFEDIEDFVSRVSHKVINKKVLESLIKCGAFDFSKVSRRELHESIDQLLRSAQLVQREHESGQLSLFGSNDGTLSKAERRKLNLPEWATNTKLRHEREALGFYITGHPLKRFRKGLARIALTTKQASQKSKNSIVAVAGVVTALKLKNTKKGDRYASFILEDEIGTLEALVWPDTYRNVAEILASDTPVLCKAKADISEERCTLIVESIQPLAEVRNQQTTSGRIKSYDIWTSKEKLEKLREILTRHSGTVPLHLNCRHNNHVFEVLLPISVTPSEALCDEVEELCGGQGLYFV